VVVPRSGDFQGSSQDGLAHQIRKIACGRVVAILITGSVRIDLFAYRMPIRFRRRITPFQTPAKIAELPEVVYTVDNPLSQGRRFRDVTGGDEESPGSRGSRGGNGGENAGYRSNRTGKHQLTRAEENLVTGSFHLPGGE
jgi:hypothetical protein